MCELCKQNPCDRRCPNSREQDISKKIGRCMICDETIIDDEEHIELNNGEIVCKECYVFKEGL